MWRKRGGFAAEEDNEAKRRGPMGWMRSKKNESLRDGRAGIILSVEFVVCFW
jgi:hypothetical protein